MNKQLTNFLTRLDRDQIPYIIDEPLNRHTTFRIGGPAAVFCTPEQPMQLVAALQASQELGLQTYLLGRGSNTLFSDAGFPGVVIDTGKALGQIHAEGSRLIAGAGVGLTQLCREALRLSLSGLEFAYGIPGSLGGAVYMNAGAYDGEMKNILVEVSYLDETGHLCTAPANALQLGYRTSIFEMKKWCIVEATLQMHPGCAEEINARMEELMSRRKEKQPLEYPSAGSTFKRPQGAFAAALIEQCGLKGRTVGGAQVSEKHCGFVVNIGGATCADVIELTRQVSEAVFQQTGYRLEREIRVVE